MRCPPICRLLLLATLGAAAATAPAAEDRALVALEESGLGTLHLEASIGDRQARFLLDTGSAYVVLNRATLDPLVSNGTAEPVRKLRAVMADNRERTVQVYRLARLSLANGCVARDVEAVALPGAARNILGMSALRQVAPFTLHFDPSLLEISCGGTSAAPALAAR